MEFGTWYALNCGPREEWSDDLLRVREAGFDFVVLWNLSPSAGSQPGDVRHIVRDAMATTESLDAAARAGLRAYLGLWHPYYMGSIPVGQRLCWADGRRRNAPDLFHEQWLRRSWLPYVRTAAQRFCRHPAFRGVYFDDSFPVVPKETRSYLSYSGATRQRFRRWLRERYLTVANLNMCLRPRKAYRSFAAVNPPAQPTDDLALWTDWTAARAQWCEEFAERTCRAWRQVDGDPTHELVLSDQDYHLQCNALQYGVDYSRLAKHFDRLEVYMAANHEAVSRRELLANVTHDVRRGRRLAGSKPLQFHTWFADRRSYRPMDSGTLRAVIDTAGSLGAAAMEIYTFKVGNWLRRYSPREAQGPLPPFEAMSLRYQPQVLRAVSRAIAAWR
jgi:hypothetical protein